MKCSSFLLAIAVLAAIGSGCKPEMPKSCGNSEYCEVGTVCGPGDSCLVEPDACGAFPGEDCDGIGGVPSKCRDGKCVAKPPCELCPADSECNASGVCVVKADACAEATEGEACNGLGSSACHDSQCVPKICGGDLGPCSEGSGGSLDVKLAKVAGGDFNGDGPSDLMALYDHEQKSAGLWIFPGTTERGDSDHASVPYRVWIARPEFFDVSRAKVAGGDFNHDQLSDVLALLDYGDGSAGLWIFPGTRETDSRASRPYLVWNARSPFDLERAQVAAGNFDGEGGSDLMVMSRGDADRAGLWIFPGVTGRRKGASQPYRVWSGGPEELDVDRARVAAGDFDGDHLSDLMALYDFGDGKAGLWIFPGVTSRMPDATHPRLVWQVVNPYVPPDRSTDVFDIARTKVTGANFNADAFDDLMVIYDNDLDTSIGVFVNPGTDQPSDGFYQVGDWPRNGISSRGCRIAGGDFNDDGNDDVMVLYDYTHLTGQAGGARLWIMPGARGPTQLTTTNYYVWGGSAFGQ